MKRIAGVIGAGTMGRGITESLLVAGFHVVLVDQLPAQVEKALNSIKKSFRRGVEKGRLTQDNLDEMLARLQLGVDYSAVKDASVVLEAVYENMEAKRDVLKAVSRIVPADALIGSNTSSLSVSGMAQSVHNPGCALFQSRTRDETGRDSPGRRNSDRVCGQGRGVGQRHGENSGYG